ncbi:MULTISPECIES: hypothetical protein [Bacillus]|uniref:hypothetical protein n=1 Tax=Bacillus TaxID=1386 RepID=UPI0003745451|nr:MULTISPECIES: hypothetical protein [Bacillus]
MLRVKVKTKDTHFNIPIPYAMLNVAISIVASTFFQQKLNRWTKEYFERKKLDFTFPLIDKKMLKPIIKELKNYKGLLLVDVKAKDGTEVKVRL